MTHSTIGIALIGHGVVGGGVVRILREQADLLAARTGLRFDLRHVVVRDVGRHRAATPNVPFTSDLSAAINDPAVKVVIEVIGGTTTAADAIERALRAGKPVVTANKSLLAARGKELFALARQRDTAIAFEASCGGGIPIIDALTRGLITNRIDALVGIVNGTCNVILTRMTQNGWSYADALSEAQRLGYAEADPTLDVSGRDAAQKLALLASLAFNACVAEADIHVEGIDTIDPQDITRAAELGYVIKLLAIAERADGGLALRVHPTLVHKTDVLAEVAGSFNAISVYGHAVGHAFFYGRGAGQLPTASAVVSDLISVSLGTTTLSFRQLRIFPDTIEDAQVLPVSKLTSRYYLRLSARDEPGVLARVTTVLGNHGISLSAINQHETAEARTVPVVITTHRASEGNMRAALAVINALPDMAAPTVCLRIIDQPKEFAGG